MDPITCFLREGKYPHTKEQSMDHIPYYDHWIETRLEGDVSQQYLKWIEKYRKKGFKPPTNANFLTYNHRGLKAKVETYVDEFYSPLAASKQWNQLTSMGKKYGKFPKGIFPIATERNGDLVCLDISYKSNGSVWMWHQKGKGEIVSPIAKDFNGLLKRLKEPPDYIGEM